MTLATAEVPRLLEPPKQSFFLFGPRGSGKSTWLAQRFPKARRLDLLDETLYQELLVRPALFEELLADERAGDWVCVDEFQRLPQLLNEVHRAIEKRKLRFALSGSSARKLHRAGVNLLGGRALRRSMYPFVPEELGATFRLDEALELGLLPLVRASESPQETLTAYVQAYLREEIQAEALVRNLPGFARFLPIAALFHGQVLNVSSLARDAGVARTTVEDYVRILEDTLLAIRVPAFEARLRVRERRHPKLYWIDPGLVRALKKSRERPAPEEVGSLLEGLVAVWLHAYRDYRSSWDEISYWSSGAGVEVDFILRRGKKYVALEVKASDRARPEDGGGLSAIEGLAGLERKILVYRGRSRLQRDGVEMLPMADFLNELAAGTLFPR